MKYAILIFSVMLSIGAVALGPLGTLGSPQHEQSQREFQFCSDSIHYVGQLGTVGGDEYERLHHLLTSRSIKPSTLENAIEYQIDPSRDHGYEKSDNYLAMLMFCADVVVDKMNESGDIKLESIIRDSASGSVWINGNEYTGQQAKSEYDRAVNKINENILWGLVGEELASSIEEYSANGVVSDIQAGRVLERLSE